MDIITKVEKVDKDSPLKIQFPSIMLSKPSLTRFPRAFIKKAG
jgi:hypothetical protein